MSKVKNKAKAVKATKEELEAIKAHNAKVLEESKMPEKLEIQKNYIESKLILSKMKAELEVLQEECLKEDGTLSVQWMGRSMPLEVCKTYFNLAFYNYKKELANYNKVEKKISEMYNEDQIKQINLGEFIKE